MTNWTTYKLAEVCSKIGSGATPKGGKSAYITEGISLIRSQNVLDFNFTEDGLAFINEAQAKALANVEVQERDVLVNITGDSVARVCQVPNKFLPARVNQHVAILRSDTSKLSPEFVKYSLLTKYNKDRLLSLASTGATRNALTKSMLEDFEISAPEDVTVQNRIAEILSALDDKIELNRRMNQTLEQMSLKLYYEWFVDFGPFKKEGLVESELGMIPQGWKVYSLGDIAKFRYGKMPKKDLITTGGYPVYSGYRITGYYPEFNCEKSKVIIVARGVGGTGDVKLTPAKCYVTNLSIILDSDSEKLIDRIFYYRFVIRKLTELSSGSAQPQITINDLERIKIELPDVTIQSKFLEIVKPWEDQIEQNQNEIATLTQLRDTLLPKLMSGEIDVMQMKTDELHEPVLS